MRVFITSTPDELEAFQLAAIDVVREFGHQPVLRDLAGRRGRDPVTACAGQVARANAVLAIVGWRRGRVPSVTLGGDDLRPWSYWEVQSAFKHQIPVVALLAGEAFEPELREGTAEARAVMADFRGELARLAAVFEGEPEFRRLARVKLRQVDGGSQASGSAPADPRPRKHPSPELPTQPYPLLLPYTHPDLMAGRDDDLAELLRILARPVTVVGLHAASGTGKSSLLAGGLVPKLRAEGRSVAFVRHPAEADLIGRLLGDLIEKGEAGPSAGKDFMDRLITVRGLSDSPPVLVIDQFEDLLKGGAEAFRTLLGTHLAASAQRLPGAVGPPCRWLLAYRQEYHGKVISWLEDVLRDARRVGLAGIDTLPHDLSRPSRFVAFALRPLASPPPGSVDPIAASAWVFLDAIEKPLRFGAFPWRFAPGAAERLARAFAEARFRQPKAPFVPELQVVLAHLLEQAGEPVGGGPVTVDVPEDPVKLIDRALEDHLRRALDFAFPRGLDLENRIARARALLVLRELASVHGRRQEGHQADTLARALGEQGGEVLEKLSTPRTRIVLLERRGQHWVYVLAHDRLAEVLVRVVDEERWAGLGIDAKLLGLRRFVALQSQLHASGDAEQATALPSGPLAGKIEAHKEVLLWHDQQREWWAACLERRRLEHRRKAMRRVVASLALALVALMGWMVAERWAGRRLLLDRVAAGEPEIAFAALGDLTRRLSHDAEELSGRLREREYPFDVFERGLGGVGEELRAEVLVRVAEIALSIPEAENTALIASLVWALDFFAAEDFPERASVLREKVLGPLRRSRPPPSMPGPGDPNWADIPGGTFWMGAGPKDGRDAPNMQDEKPKHQVTLSAFRMMTHEVTNIEFRRLFPGHKGADDLPAVSLTWYEAYAYAAWLGGRLPTESEWEYAARAGCAHAYCKRDGSEAMLDEVAWWLGNAADPETGQPLVNLVRQLEPNPWGLWDIYGNVWEWNATWHGSYQGAAQIDPPGPTDTSPNRRSCRGGSVGQRKKWVLASGRGAGTPDVRSPTYGFRVVIAE